MARKIRQFRYYSNEASSTGKNAPVDISYQKLISGSVFSDSLPILQLGIQALPGTKFYVNNSSDPIIIGSTGIYELDLIGETEITALSFDAQSVLAINNNENAYLIVDVIYEKEE